MTIYKIKYYILLFFILFILSGCLSVKNNPIGRSTIKLFITNIVSERSSVHRPQFNHDETELFLNHDSGGYVYNLLTRKISYNFDDNDNVYFSSLSAHGNYLLVGLYDKVKLWDYRKHTLLKQWEVGNKDGLLAAISADEHRLLVGKSIVDIEGLIRRPIKFEHEIGGSIGSTPCFSPDGRYLVITYQMGRETDVMLIDVEKAELLGSLEYSDADSRALFSSDSRRVFVIYDQQENIAVYNTASIEKRIDNLMTTDTITDAVVMPNSKNLFVVTEGGNLYLWNTDSLALQRKWHHSSPAKAVVADSKGHIWVGYKNGDILVYNAASGFNKVKTLGKSIYNLAVSKSGTRLAAVVLGKLGAKPVVVMDIQ